jgi:hypothetical protein
LETFLASGVPELKGDNAVVNCYFFGEEIGADGGFVGCGEFLVYLNKDTLECNATDTWKTEFTY